MSESAKTIPTAKPATAPWQICLFLALITFALYWPVRHFEFNNYDDAQYLTENPYVQNGLTSASIKWAFTSRYAANWHPLTWLSHLLDIKLYGFNAGGHHFTNLLFHVASTILLFLLLRQYTGALWRSAFVAALFAWHPLHVESVAWVAERKDVLSAFFWMLTLLAYGKYAQDQSRRAGNSPPPDGVNLYFVLAVASFALGLMAKPMVVNLPLILLLLDYWPLKRLSGPRSAVTPAATSDSLPAPRQLTLVAAITEKVPFIVLAAVSCLITFLVQKRYGAVRELSNFPMSERIANALVSYATYLAKIFWPARLAIPYPYEHNLPALEIIGAALVLLAVSTLALYLIKSHPPLFVGWLWFIISLIPVIGLVQVGGEPMADRYTYVPSIGIFIIVAWVILPRLDTGWPARNPITFSLASFVLVACLVTTSRQITYWNNSISLWTHAIAVTKDNATAHCNLGAALFARGNIGDAIEHERISLKINPDNPEAENNLGWFLGRQGKWAEAVPHFRAAADSRIKRDKFYLNLGLAYLNTGKPDDAVPQFRRFISLNPNFAFAHACLADALTQQHHFDEAIEQLRIVLQLTPNDIPALQKLSWLLATAPDPRLRNASGAVDLAALATQLAPLDPTVWDAQAAAFANAGDYNKAINAATRALQLVPPSDQALTKEIQSRLALYRSGTPFHQPRSPQN
jgi:Tfp pilus assembly protein PilF